jgi:hypothetical protein
MAFMGIKYGVRDRSYSVSSSSIPARKSGARQSDLPCPAERLQLQRIKKSEQFLLLCLGEFSEAPGYVLCLASVPLNGTF